MKFNIIKTIIAFSISLLLGLLCYVIAKDVDHRNIISLSIATLTISACFASAFAIDYNCGNRNINIKVAYLHAVTDMLVSVGVVISGFVIYYTGWNIIDSILSLVITLVIAVPTLKLIIKTIKLIKSNI